jgi:hypothetical protein
MAKLSEEVVGQVLRVPRVRIRPFIGQPRGMADTSNPELEL